MLGCWPAKHELDVNSLQDHVEREEVTTNRWGNLTTEPRASGCISTQKKDPHEMGSEKGNVKGRRNVQRPQMLEKIGSSGRIRTYNPPVNRRKKKH
jgi:hypothetical protein